MVREPECHKCGNTRRLFLVEPGRWLCRWQGGCDHRCEARDGRIVQLTSELDRRAACERLHVQTTAPPPWWP